MRIGLVRVAVIAGLLANPASAGPLAASGAALRERLANGFSFTLDPPPSGNSRTVLALSVRVGRQCEAKEQLELAHLVEHLVVETQPDGLDPLTFAGRAERWGGTLGGDINALTHQDRTVYWLSVSPDRPDHLAEALDLLKAWVSRPTISSVDVEREAAVIREEWRQGETPLGRAIEAVSGNGRELEERTTALASYQRSPERVTQFRDYWYRPDLMNLAVVGGGNPEHLRSIIASRFEQLDVPTAHPPECSPIASASDASIDAYQVVSDPALDADRLVIRIKSQEGMPTVDLKIIESLLRTELNRLPRRYLASVSEAQVALIDEVQEPRFLQIMTRLADGQAVEAIAEVIRRLNNVMAGNATSEEVSQAAANLSDKVALLDASAMGIARRRVELFVTGKAEADPREALADASPVSVNSTMQTLGAGKWSVAWLTQGTSSAAELERLVRAARGSQDDVSDFGQQKDAEAVLAALPPPTTAVGSPGAAVLRNGITLRFFSQDTTPSAAVNVLLIAAGGYSDGKPECRGFGPDTADAIRNGGVYGLDKFELEDFSIKSGVQVRPFLDAHRRGVYASFPAAKLQSALQLMSGWFRSADLSDIAFEDWKQADASSRSIPEVELGALVARWRDVLPPPPAPASALYQSCFVEALRSGRYYAIVQAPPELRDRISEYLSEIPLLQTNQQSLDDSSVLPEPDAGKTTLLSTRLQGKALVRIESAGVFTDQSWIDKGFVALRDELERRLYQRLRLEERGVYSVLINASAARAPDRFSVSVQFDCAPENAERLAATVLDEFRRLREGPDFGWTSDNTGVAPPPTSIWRLGADAIAESQGRPVQKEALTEIEGRLVAELALNPASIRSFIVLPLGGSRAAQ